MDRVLKSMYVHFKELNTGADDADEMPEVQETVTMIPGSTLLWRINPRPAHANEVALSRSFLPGFANMVQLSFFWKAFTVNTQVLLDS